MSSDLFTKNLPGPKFETHTKVYCGLDEYIGADDIQGEDVPGPSTGDGQTSTDKG